MSYASVEIQRVRCEANLSLFADARRYCLLLHQRAKRRSLPQSTPISYTFSHPRGGISHTEPSESQDSGRTGTTLSVSIGNPLVRKHREYPPHGDTTLVIFRQNEVSGTPYQIWSGTLFSPLIEGVEARFECLTDFELMARAEGLNDTFQGLCNWFLYHHPCPVNKANWRVGVAVVDIDTDNFTLKFQEQERLLPTTSRRAGWKQRTGTSDQLSTIRSPVQITSSPYNRISLPQLYL